MQKHTITTSTTLYKNHGADVGYWKVEVTDNAELKISHARTMLGKPTVRIVQCVGKNIGRANETSDLEQAFKEAEARVRKQKDKGYVDTIEEAGQPATNQLGTVLPMLATVFEKVKPASIDWDNAYAQVKLNGNRCIYSMGQLTSRGGKVIDLPHIVEGIHKLGLQDLVLDGELYIHGMPLQELNSLIRRPREASKQLQFHIFDVVSDQPYHIRHYPVRCITPHHLTIKAVQCSKVSSHAEALKLTDYWVANGYEGGILRHGTQGYEAGKRSRNLLKLKTYKDAEAEVIGHTIRDKAITVVDGVRTEYDIFVWVCKNPFGEGTFNVTAAGSHAEIHAQLPTASKQIGRELTFKYFELSKDNVPQQPIALHWRDEADV